MDLERSLRSHFPDAEFIKTTTHVLHGGTISVHDLFTLSIQILTSTFKNQYSKLKGFFFTMCNEHYFDRFKKSPT